MALVTITVDVPAGKRADLRKKLAELGFPEVKEKAPLEKQAKPKAKAASKLKAKKSQPVNNDPIKWPDVLPTKKELFARIENGPTKPKLNRVQKDVLAGLLAIEEEERGGKKLQSFDDMMAELKPIHDKYWADKDARRSK